MQLILEQKKLIKKYNPYTTYSLFYISTFKNIGWLKCLWATFSLIFIQKDDFFVLWQLIYKHAFLKKTKVVYMIIN